LDPGVTRLAPSPPVAAAPANEFFSFTCNNLTIKYLEDVGTFDPASGSTYSFMPDDIGRT
jgi:hypothetical protein